MSERCSSSACNGRHLRKQCCPVNGYEYAEVPIRTITHHIKAPWAWQPSAQRYFFCDDPACEVVYFGDDGSTILKQQLRTPPGQKETSADRRLCYCFGITEQDFQRNPNTRDYVLAQTKSGHCACETSNPSGRCCLKDFPPPADE
ncbi:MAG: hypothetical protein PHT48_03135 [Dechloromonas sp.]|nr:hypothetical protein [Dechloromonas sp.]